MKLPSLVFQLCFFCAVFQLVKLQNSCTTYLAPNATSIGYLDCAVGSAQQFLGFQTTCVPFNSIYSSISEGKSCSTISDCYSDTSLFRTYGGCFNSICDWAYRSVGDACIDNKQCSSGTCVNSACAAVNPTPLSALNEVCSNNYLYYKRCQSGLFCSDEADLLLSYLATRNGTCKALKGLYESCTGGECSENLICIDGACSPKRSNGQRCTFNECDQGLYCSSSVCTPQRSEGQGCTSQSHCSTGLVCIKNRCINAQYTKNLGDSCFINDECSEGLYCRSGKCNIPEVKNSRFCDDYCSKGYSNKCACTESGGSICSFDSSCLVSRNKMNTCFDTNGCFSGYDFDPKNCKQKKCRNDILRYYQCMVNQQRMLNMTIEVNLMPNFDLSKDIAVSSAPMNFYEIGFIMFTLFVVYFL